MLNKLMKLSAVAVMTAGLVACSSGTTATTETLTGTATGKNGDVTVEVEYSEGTIKSVTVTEQQETEGIADPALEQIPEEIVKANSTDVDDVSGATITSKAIKEAVDNALDSAK